MNLVQKMLDDTSFLSSPSMIEETRAYKAVLKEGNDVVPLLLKSLESRPSIATILALRRITGFKPRAAAGDIQALASAWLSGDVDAT